MHGHNVAVVCVALGGFESESVILNTCVADRYVHTLDNAWMGAWLLRLKDEDLHGTTIDFDCFNTMGHDSRSPLCLADVKNKASDSRH